MRSDVGLGGDGERKKIYICSILRIADKSTEAPPYTDNTLGADGKGVNREIAELCPVFTSKTGRPALILP